MTSAIFGAGRALPSLSPPPPPPPLLPASIRPTSVQKSSQQGTPARCFVPHILLKTKQFLERTVLAGALFQTGSYGTGVLPEERVPPSPRHPPATFVKKNTVFILFLKSRPGSWGFFSCFFLIRRELTHRLTPKKIKGVYQAVRIKSHRKKKSGCVFALRPRRARTEKNLGCFFPYFFWIFRIQEKKQVFFFYNRAGLFFCQRFFFWFR